MRKNLKSLKTRVGISVGDINGVGLEVIMKAFSDSRIFDFCTPLLYASSSYVLDYQKKIGLKNFSFHPLKNTEKPSSKKLNLIDCWDEDIEIHFGEDTEAGGAFALKSLSASVNGLKNNEVDVLVTAPINKYNIQSKEFNFPGHTEYLAKEFDGKALMFMVTDSLRIGVVTGHIPISDIASSISETMISEKIEQIDASLKCDFNIRKPKIAVLGLNPHSGDKGLIGKEDIDIITPAIKNAFDSGKLVYGPYPADGFFASSTYKQFDAVLAMYHDQGLIPFKTLSFNKGVNFTAGLSIVRTSPDHGTAFDLAGKNEAQEASFREAIYVACSIHKRRVEYLRLNKNPLAFNRSLNKR